MGLSASHVEAHAFPHVHRSQPKYMYADLVKRADTHARKVLREVGVLPRGTDRVCCWKCGSRAACSLLAVPRLVMGRMFCSVQNACCQDGTVCSSCTPLWHGLCFGMGGYEPRYSDFLRFGFLVGAWAPLDSIQLTQLVLRTADDTPHEKIYATWHRTLFYCFAFAQVQGQDSCCQSTEIPLRSFGFPLLGAVRFLW